MRFAIIICCLFIVNIPAVHAVSASSKEKISHRALDKWEVSLERFTTLYDRVLDEMQTSVNLEHNIRTLHEYYARTWYYDPFAEDILDRLTEYAQIVEMSDDPVEKNEALRAFRSLVTTHLANIDVVYFAKTMSSVDIRFGSEDFYSRVVSALMKKITTFPGECDKAKNACRIITYAEESILLEKTGGKVTHSEIFEVSGRYYNVHDIRTKDGREIQMFMDVTMPIANASRTRAVEERQNNVDTLGK